MATALYDTVSEKDHFSFYSGDHLDYGNVVKTLEFKKEDVSKATGVPLASVRYEEEKISQELRERIREWAVLLNLVAQHFKGDVKKTCLWFTIPNPLLGEISPRDMIRFGRYRKLFKFIVNATGENVR
jgi:uncharacterized protein (DUF2384 family)